MEPHERTQARRDLITQLLTVHGYQATLDSLTGYAFKDGHLVNLAKDPTSLDLIPYLATIKEEMDFQKRMKFISKDGSPPHRKSPPAHANDPETLPTPEFLKRILLEALTQAAPKKNNTTTPRPRPHASKRTQGNLF